jgi:hypothetical protein
MTVEKKGNKKTISRQEEHKLAVWLDEQLRNYKNRTGELANPEHHAKFTEFLRKYNYIFNDREFVLLGMTRDEVKKL